MIDTTPQTRQVVARWAQAHAALRRLRAQVISAECELANATNDLGKWLTPEDAHMEEQFQLWYGSGILQAKKIGQNDFSVGWRKLPDTAEERSELHLS